MLVYEALNRPVLARVPASAKQVLDIGCGSGAFGQAVKQRTGCRVEGITYSEAEAALARTVLDDVIVQDLNHFDPSGLGSFDCVVCSHVLEHLYAPQILLAKLRACIAPGATLLVALPNVLHWRQRRQFLAGRFRYTEGGLMDQTHFRFFDFGTAKAMLRDCGYEVLTADADGNFPFSRLLPAGIGSRIDRWALRRWPGLFGFQFIFTCRLAA